MESTQFEVTRSDEEWRRLLTPEQYDVMRGHGTEAPGSCVLNFEKRITKDVFAVLTVDDSVKSRVSHGGTAPKNVRRQANRWLNALAKGR